MASRTTKTPPPAGIAPRQGVLRRVRLSVPEADTSANAWLDLQENVSRSLQTLIRESIMRDGYIDVVNRPVEQLPRRGRPPQTSSADEAEDAADDVVQSERVTAATNEVAPPAPAPVAEPVTQEAAPLEQSAPAAPATAPTSPVTTASAPSASGQVDIDDIFGHHG